MEKKILILKRLGYNDWEISNIISEVLDASSLIDLSDEQRRALENQIKNYTYLGNFYLNTYSK